MLPVRSPAPAMRPGMSAAVAVRHLLIALRVAILVPASKLGHGRRPPGQAALRAGRPRSGPCPATRWPGGAPRPRGAARPASAAAVEGRHLVGNVEVLVDREAEERLGEANLVRSRADRRAPPWCRCDAARASRCGCARTSSDGRSASAMARRRPASRASRSFATSPRCSTCQP